MGDGHHGAWSRDPSQQGGNGPTARGGPGRGAAVTHVLVRLPGPGGPRDGGAWPWPRCGRLGAQGWQPRRWPEPRLAVQGAPGLGRPPCPLALPPSSHVTPARGHLGTGGRSGRGPDRVTEGVEKRTGSPGTGSPGTGSLGPAHRRRHVRSHCPVPGPRTGPARAASCPRFLGAPPQGHRGGWGLTTDGCGKGRGRPCQARRPDAPRFHGRRPLARVREHVPGSARPMMTRWPYVPGWALGDAGSSARRN